MKNFFLGHLRLLAVVVIIILALGAGWYIFSNRPPVLGSYTISSGNVTEALDEPGTVAAEDKVGLSFQEAGQIADVYAQEGETVDAGAKLADLNSDSLKAELEQAQAALDTAEANYQELINGDTADQINVDQKAVNTAESALQSASTTLATTQSQQDTAVQNAYNTLLNTAFSAVPGSGNTDNVTATISGTYNGSQGGVYSISIYSTGGSLKFQSGGLESANGNVQTQAAPLGTKGLYIQFSATPSTSDTWTVTIPNTYAAGYTANFNAYQAALQTQTAQMAAAQAQINAAGAALAQAQANLQLAQSPPRPEDIAKQQAVVAQAKAATDASQVALDNALLTAPFPGTVQDLTAQVGQVVSPGSTVLSLVNNSGLKIQTYVSEADVAKLKAGDLAQVTLDAFGTGTAFPATVTTIDSTQTQVNGTPSYLVVLHFVNLQAQISDGMTGNIHIILAQDDNVVEVPTQLVINNGNQYFVLVKTPTGAERQQVQVGLMGDDGMTEITSGLSQGDTLINF